MTDIVIAHFDEDLSWVNDLEWLWDPANKLFIYSKGENHQFGLNWDYTLRKLPNVGREGHTYLFHMLYSYPYQKQTVFLQGNPIDHMTADGWMRLLKLDIPVVPMYPLGRVLWCDHSGAPHHRSLGNNIQDSYSEWFDTEERFTGTEFTPGACFASNGQIYADLRTLFRAYSWLGLGVNPIEGYCLERLWTRILTGAWVFDVYEGSENE